MVLKPEPIISKSKENRSLSSKVALSTSEAKSLSLLNWKCPPWETGAWTKWAKFVDKLSTSFGTSLYRSQFVVSCRFEYVKLAVESMSKSGVDWGPAVECISFGSIFDLSLYFPLFLWCLDPLKKLKNCLSYKLHIYPYYGPLLPYLCVTWLDK